MISQTGDIVRVRSRQYLVEGVDLPPQPGDSSLVRLSCLEDDAQGEPLEGLWEREIDAGLLREADWERIASRGFDQAKDDPQEVYQAKDDPQEVYQAGQVGLLTAPHGAPALRRRRAGG